MDWGAIADAPSNGDFGHGDLLPGRDLERVLAQASAGQLWKLGEELISPFEFDEVRCVHEILQRAAITRHAGLFYEADSVPEDLRQRRRPRDISGYYAEESWPPRSARHKRPDGP
jgi:hypothetical protein